MKNIHILPTDKPSRLIHYLKDNSWDLFNSPMPKIDNVICQNIYITNDEIVTKYSKGLYFIDIYTGRNDIFSPLYINKDTIAAGKFHAYMNNGNMCKKIIMTTDPILILNGVQSIPDEFLEWFVKNPSCENVEVDSYKTIHYTWIYKIIIPKKEPKQPFYCSDRLELDDNEKCETQCDVCSNKPKQETLEESAERFVEAKQFRTEEKDKSRKYCFIQGAKWQQEQDKNKYSEEEVEIIIQELMNDVHCGDLCYGDNVIDFKLSPRQWFQKFKKK
jgi:hypothetical protein